MNLKNTIIASAIALVAIGCTSEKVEETTKVVSPYAQWEKFKDSSSDEFYFPIGVYTQDPKDAGEYKELGVNFYYYLWAGPTAEQMAELRKHDMRVLAEFNDYAQKNLLDDTLVIAWTHIDEPDLIYDFSRAKLAKMGQEKTKEIVKRHWPKMYDEMNLDTEDYKGWGFGHSAILVREGYEHIKQIDKTRPVFLGLSQSVVKAQNSRGDRKGHREDYRAYADGCSDVLAFDVYPVYSHYPEKLYKVADGVDSLNSWNASQPKFVAIECTVGFPDRTIATPEQIRSEIWTAIIRGARGVSYFVHNWNKEGKLIHENGLLHNPEMMKGITKQNAELTSLAKVIYAEADNSVSLSNADVALDYVAKKVDGYLYILSGTNRPEALAVEFAAKGIKNATVEVINENRTLEMKDGKFADSYKEGYDVHLYKVKL